MSSAGTVHGDLKTWHKITLDFVSPETFSEEPETFRDYRLDVTFENKTTGEVITVPGFFAADGDAANSGATEGAVWRVNFNAPSEGEWTYTASFRTGTDIAASADPNAGTPVGFIDGETGTFDVAPTDATGDDFRAKGMILQDEGTHFLQFQGDEDYFIRGGPGVPENFLATTDFDNTGDGRHDFSTHLSDYQGDGTTWAGGKGEAILGAVNYLADQGQNTIYLLTNTVGGDGRDVGPWVDPDIYDVPTHRTSIEDAAADTGGLSAEAFSVYDVSKLAQWELLFDHMDDQGIYKNVLFQETENDQLLNGGTDVAGSTLSVERMVYMREMIARFGHNNGIQWNLGEENTQTDQQRIDMAAWTKQVDPYDHLVVIHTYPGDHGKVYDPLLGVEDFDGPSFQTGAGSIRSKTAQYRDDSAANGDPWVLAWDEDSGSRAVVNAYESDADSTNERQLRDGLWGHLTAGGSGVNWYLKGNSFGGHSFDQNLDDFKGFESLWTWTAAATDFFNTYIPFWAMTEQDGVTQNTGDYVLARDGAYYTIYLDYGQADDVRLDLTGHDDKTFDVFWYNPRLGGPLIDAGEIAGGAVQQIGGAPADQGKDWVILVRDAALSDKPDGIAFDDVPDTPDNPDDDGGTPPQDTGSLTIDLWLVDPQTNQRVEQLSADAVIDPDDLSSGQYSIEAVPSGSAGSVRFTLGGHSQTENVQPYALFGDSSGNFDGSALPSGPQALKVDVFAGQNGSGGLIGTAQLAFSVGEAGSEPPADDPDAGDMPDGSEGAPSDPMDIGDGYYEGVKTANNFYFKMQIEDAGTDPNGKWRFVDQPDGAGNQAGFEGAGYYIYGGEDSLGINNVFQDEILSFRIYVPEGEEGVYNFRYRVARDGQHESDKQNDAWVGFQAVGQTDEIEDYLTGHGGNRPHPTNSDMVKVYGGPNNGSWGYATHFDGEPGNKPLKLDIKEAGYYDLTIAGRSQGFHIDALELYKGDKPQNGADNSAFVSEAPGDGDGGDDGSDADTPPPPPPNVEPSALDDIAETDSGVSILIDVLGNDSDDDGGVLSIAAFGPAANGALAEEAGQIRYTPGNGFSGTDSFTYKINDGQGGQDTATVSVTVNAPPPPPVEDDPDPVEPGAKALLTAINIGGSQSVTAVDGTVFEADTVSTGNQYAVTASIAGTEDDGIYRSEAWSPQGLSYDFDVGNGTYEVVLHFAEIWGGARTVGKRIFDIEIEDVQKVDGLDLFATAGFRTAHIETFTVEVTDGTLDIDLIKDAQNPKLSALEIWSVDASEPAAPAEPDDVPDISEPEPAPGGSDLPEPSPDTDDATFTPTFGTYKLADTSEQSVLFDLKAKTVIDAGAVDGRNLSLVTTTDDPAVESVTLEWNGDYARTENVTPYTLFGDTDGDLFEGKEFAAGDHEIATTFFDRALAKGTALASDTLEITVAAGTVEGTDAAEMYLLDTDALTLNRIDGFGPGDQLQFRGEEAPGTAQDILDRATVIDGDTVIDFGDGHVLTLGDFTDLQDSDIYIPEYDTAG